MTSKLLRRWHVPIGSALVALVALLATAAVAQAQGSIQGMAYLDRNCNGLREAYEPALVNWKIYVRGQVDGLPPVLDSTTTTADGDYSFGSLNAGDYAVSAEVQAGYFQTAPVSVDHQFALGASESATGKDFTFRAAAECDVITPVVCQAGMDDMFDPANGSEPSSPSAGLLAQLNTCNSALPFFDQAAVNACFGHTFSNCWDRCGVVTATLQMRLRASSDGSQNDELHFGDWPDPGSLWHSSLSQLLEIKTGGADASWDPGDSMTLTLDLAALPVATRGLTNIIASLQDGDLDVYVGDNTEIDHLKVDMEDG